MDNLILGNTMIGTPIDVIPYVRGIQLVLTGYSGYTKGKRREADKIIRDEIVRASNRARNHVLNIHDNTFRDGDVISTRAAKSCLEEIDAFMEDVRKSMTGMDHAFLSGLRSASNSDLKKLIQHDHEVIEMVTKAVNISNSAEQALAIGIGDVKGITRQCQQMISSCRGFYGSRVKLLGGIRQKRKV